jgi:hypothetical protein
MFGIINYSFKYYTKKSALMALFYFLFDSSLETISNA